MTSHTKRPQQILRRALRLAPAVLLAIAALCRISRADTLATVADPVAMSAGATDAILSILTTFGPLWGGMALVFGAASKILEKNQSQHWIAQGRTLAILTAAVGLGIAALMAHFGGAAWGGVLLTLVLGVFKLINPNTVVPSAGSTQGSTQGPGTSTTAPAGPVPITMATQAGFAHAGLPATLTAVTIAVAIIACGAAQKASRAVIDCTGGDTASVVANILATLNEWSQPEDQGGCRTSNPDGFDFDCAESKAIAKGEQIGGCALAELVDGTSASSQAPRVVLDAAAASKGRNALEDFRVHHARNAVFHFADKDR